MNKYNENTLSNNDNFYFNIRCYKKDYKNHLCINLIEN